MENNKVTKEDKVELKQLTEDVYRAIRNSTNAKNTVKKAKEKLLNKLKNLDIYSVKNDNLYFDSKDGLEIIRHRNVVDVTDA